MKLEKKKGFSDLEYWKIYRAVAFHFIILKIKKQNWKKEFGFFYLA